MPKRGPKATKRTTGDINKVERGLNLGGPGLVLCLGADGRPSGIAFARLLAWGTLSKV